uniref:Uncharacterized protein n=1 Tax=Myripristis murdjan TaxID=586833 RepID=A0A667ZGT9_9TELE
LPFHQGRALLRNALYKLGVSYFSPFNPKPPPSRSKNPPSGLERPRREAELWRRPETPPTLRLGGRGFSFQRGRWAARRERRAADVEALQRRNRRLKAENRRLRLEVDVLVDMMTDMKLEAETASSAAGTRPRPRK